jgi:hypothetical protein
MSTRVTRDRSRATGNSPRPAAEQLSSPQVPDNLITLAEAATTVEAETESSSSGAVRTRSGRVSKPPVRYEPVEQVEDDYAPEDYDTEDPDDSSEDIETDEDEEDDESDADEDGNLDGFVVPDKSESSDSDSDGEPPVPVAKRRAVVKKRPASGRA